MVNLQALLKAQDAVIIAHYYVPANIQKIAEETGGFIGDSLAMARFGQEHSAATLIIAGVKFMGETAKILSPQKRVLMVDSAATCSLDLSCPPAEFDHFCDQYPDRTVVVYANTSAAVKARADWVVTSSNAVAVVNHLDAGGHKILWAPDRYLGRYVAAKTGADLVLWQGACIVHEEFQAKGLAQLKLQYPQAGVLVHPESPPAVVDMADVVGSTSELLRASRDMPQQMFIVATDLGIFYKMQQASPNKQFLAAPTGGNGATCQSCGHCPWMALNTSESLVARLQHPENEIQVPEEIMRRARISLQRMVDFKEARTTS